MNGSPWLQFVPFAIVAIPIVFVTSRIMKKVGLSGWWGIVWMVPPLNVGLFIWMAYADWPIEKDLRRAREAVDILQAIKS